MLKAIEVAFSCYAVKSMPAARRFYEGVLNLQPTSVMDGGENQFTEYELGPHTLAIGSGPGFNPSPDGGAVALEVDDFDEAIKHLQAHQVKFRFGPIETPVCRMAGIFDVDGNSLIIHKRHPNRT